MYWRTTTMSKLYEEEGGVFLGKPPWKLSSLDFAQRRKYELKCEHEYEYEFQHGRQ
jgi:hypothetical protein